MAIGRVAMPEQDAHGPRRTTSARSTSASPSSSRCSRRSAACSAPSRSASRAAPSGVNIPRFIKALRDGDMPAAAESLLSRQRAAVRDRPGLPAGEPVRGRLHPRRRRATSVAIGHLERFVADWAQATATSSRTTPARADRQEGRASSAPGPAGLTAAGELAKLGHDVTVFEAFHAPGGVLIYGIPEFRLPKDIVQAEVRPARRRGREDRGRTRSSARPTRSPSCARRFDAVFLAVGRGPAGVHGRPGREPQGRLLGQRVPDPGQPHGRLERRLRHAGPPRPAGRGRRRRQRRHGRGPHRAPPGCRRGDDRLPPRSADELPARAEEVHHAERRGRRVRVPHRADRGPRRREPLGHRPALRRRMELGEPDASGRRRPTPSRDPSSRSPATSSSSRSARGPIRC